ncbi:hypothetical protein BC835DRAFT_784490 [Cytidiella melzeri]|nr:hypothetical protein BC835DRAFT_784490 [Cytidiella melzeri]
MHLIDFTLLPCLPFPIVVSISPIGTGSVANVEGKTTCSLASDTLWSLIQIPFQWLLPSRRYDYNMAILYPSAFILSPQ